ncbi:MAG: lipoate--protein ligase family protein [Candidatus Omnitrophota bacterium]|nr:MAG: lipoate--protein ligase family protein [Candidatus Omnitrophota bacterium]
MGKNWRLTLDLKHNGYYNMAVDEAMLLHYSSHRIPTLRIYGWEEPFISLGYHQLASEVLASPQSIPFVRRITGGSAILHDKEITYSLVCSLSDLKLNANVKESYKKLTSFLKHFYFQLGLDVKYAVDTGFSNLGHYGNFCYSRWQHYDFVMRGKKIGGNAQRRKKDIVFQHGSIPQDIDFNLVKNSINEVGPVEEATTSLNDILAKVTDFSQLQSLLVSSFETYFNLKLKNQSLSAPEQRTVKYLLENKYRKETWNLRNEKACLAQ